MGYLTANIRLDPACGLKHGIYAVRAGIGDKRIGGVASFGRRPTFDNGAPLLEVFLFDFKGDLYGQQLDIAFIGFIRSELKFDGIDALVRQMDDDSARPGPCWQRRRMHSRSSELSRTEGLTALSDVPHACYLGPMLAQRTIIVISSPASA
jgi:hypothetical protein